ncbi:MAG: hypothetical protein HY328_05155, partial [Chloroflexi bacterium]|nr:hypothetical protein [Chloroflexota bacterium]
ATITIPESVKAYFPATIDPSQLWVNYNPLADSLTVYFNGAPTPSVWDDVDEYAFIGFALDDDTVVTGVKIEHFTRWLLVADQPERVLAAA